MERTWHYKKPQLIQEKPEYEEKQRHLSRWNRGRPLAWATWMLTVHESGLYPRWKRQRWSDRKWDTAQSCHIANLLNTRHRQILTGRTLVKCHSVVPLLSAQEPVEVERELRHQHSWGLPQDTTAGGGRDCPVMMTEPHPLSHRICEHSAPEPWPLRPRF